MVRLTLVVLILAPATAAAEQGAIEALAQSKPKVAATRVEYADGLRLRVFRPPEANEPVPAVVFAIGVSDDEALAQFGVRLGEHPQYTAWAQVVAREGLVAVLYETDDPEGDLPRVFSLLRRRGEELGVDRNRLGLWSCSQNVLVALPFALRADQDFLRFAVFYYGWMDSPSGPRTDLPMLVVKAGRDLDPRANRTIREFMLLSAEKGLPVAQRVYEQGTHAFDIHDSRSEAVAVVRETLEFMTHHASRYPSSP